jgi:hypothetical protein
MNPVPPSGGVQVQALFGGPSPPVAKLQTRWVGRKPVVSSLLSSCH